MPDRQTESIIGKVLTRRTEALEILVLAVVLAFAINVLASVMASAAAIPSVTAAAILLIASATYIALRRIGVLDERRVVNGVLVFDAKAKRFVDVPEYALAENATMHLEAAFQERPGWEAQWKAHPLDGSEKDEGGDDGRVYQRPSWSIQLTRELLEYLLLLELSTTLEDFFGHADIDPKHVQELGRKDIPDVLLSNRFLDLFSQPMEDRGFDVRAAPTHGVVVSAFDGGRIYERLNLVLPAGSRVRRETDGAVVIDGRLVTVRLRPVFDGFGAVLPHHFEEYYLDRKQHTLELWTFAARAEIEVKVKWRALLASGWREYSWVTEFLDTIESEFSHEAFFERINWPGVEALVTILGRSPSILGRSPSKVPTEERQQVLSGVTSQGEATKGITMHGHISFDQEDQAFEERFDFSETHRLQLDVKPAANVHYWRLGIEFSADLRFSGWRYGVGNPLWHLTKNADEDRLLADYYDINAATAPSGLVVAPYHSEAVKVVVTSSPSTVRIEAGTAHLEVPLPQHRFARLFAWADKRPYSIEVDLIASADPT